MGAIGSGCSLLSECSDGTGSEQQAPVDQAPSQPLSPVMVSSVYAESASPADGRGADQNVIQVTKVTASPADERVAQSM